METEDSEVQVEVIALGAVSVETKGAGFETEVMGEGNIPFAGISDE